MRVQLYSSIKKILGLAGAAGLSLTLLTPAAIAQVQDSQLLAQNDDDIPVVIPPTGDEFDPLTIENLFYNLDYWDLAREGFICVNNPNPSCENPERELTNHSIPEARYEVNDETWDFVCVNNPDPECDNPIHYGIYYDEAAEELEELTIRTAPLWAQLEDSLNRQPTVSIPDPAPIETTTPPPIEPVPGLW